jgi:yeast amino acid transporter
MNLSASGGTVFTWLLNITAIAGFITWACINGCHIAFMRALAARNVSRDTLPYKAAWQPFFSWYGLFFNVLIILTNGFTAFIPWSTANFFTAYISVILFVVMYVGHKVIMRTKFVGALEADIDSGCIVNDDTTWSIEVPTTLWGKFWAWVC